MAKPVELDPAALLDEVLELARDAGRRILDYYEGDYRVREKSDRTPVTDADLIAHHVLCAGLDALAAEVPIISEEAPAATLAERRTWPWYWLLDPLDGTREFIHGSGQFTVNVALMQAGRPRLGVIHVPVSGATYFACHGDGAFHQSRGAPPRPIQVRDTPRHPPVVAVSRSRRGPRLHRFLNNLGPHETIVMGSSLKSCLVAEGRADIYPCFGPTSEWDTAAAQCIVEEAGGRVTDLSLHTLQYNRRESMLNPPFFAFGASAYDWSRFI